LFAAVLRLNLVANIFDVWAQYSVDWRICIISGELMMQNNPQNRKRTSWMQNYLTANSNSWAASVGCSIRCIS
jgi:hypothetical protein